MFKGRHKYISYEALNTKTLWRIILGHRHLKMTKFDTSKKNNNCMTWEEKEMRYSKHQFLSFIEHHYNFIIAHIILWEANYSTYLFFSHICLSILGVIPKPQRRDNSTAPKVKYMVWTWRQETTKIYIDNVANGIKQNKTKLKKLKLKH